MAPIRSSSSSQTMSSSPATVRSSPQGHGQGVPEIPKFSKDGTSSSGGQNRRGPGESRSAARRVRLRVVSSSDRTTIGLRFSIATATSSSSGRSSAARAGSSSTGAIASTWPTPNRDRSLGITRDGNGASGLAASRTGRSSRSFPTPMRTRRARAPRKAAADEQGNIYGAEVGPDVEEIRPANALRCATKEMRS